MKLKTGLLTAAGASIVVAGIAYWLSGMDFAADAGIVYLPAQQSTPAPLLHANTDEDKSLQLMMSKQDKNDAASELPDEEENPYASDAAKAQMMQVADLYEAASRYPVGSQPITSMQELQRFLPMTSSGVDMPFPVDGQDEPIGVSLRLARHQVFAGQPIDMELQLKNIPENASISAQARMSTLEGKTLLETGLNERESGNNQARLDGRFATDAGISQRWPVELQVVVTMEIDQHRLLTSAPLKFSAPVAILVQVEDSRQAQAMLQIPLRFQVMNPGYYFVSANLYSQTTSQPLVHLEGEGRLQGSSATLLLSAHVGALQVSGDPGPYQLRDINIVRTAEEGEANDLAGMSSREAWPVGGFSLDSYEQTPYQDELARERADFLRQLGQP